MVTEDNSNSVAKRTLNFSVNDGTDAVSGATVNVDGSTGKTGSSGGCTVKNVTDGEHSVTVTKEGYEDYTGTIIVSEDNVSFTVSLQVSG